MSATIDVPVQYLHECFIYEANSGRLVWRERPLNHFPGEGRRQFFNRNFAGKTAGGPAGKGYLEVKVDGRKLKAHRVAWALIHGAFPAEMLDHINGNRADNRMANLRPANNAQNQWNRRTLDRNSSGLKGAYRSGKGWKSLIQVNGERIDLGWFATAEAANAAYVDAAKQLHGEFANAGQHGAKGEQHDQAA